MTSGDGSDGTVPVSPWLPPFPLQFEVLSLEWQVQPPYIDDLPEVKEVTT